MSEQPEHKHEPADYEVDGRQPPSKLRQRQVSDAPKETTNGEDQ
jgi:hypothetical protein